MAWWVLVLSIAARRYSLPRALEIVAGRQSDRPVLTDPNAWERFGRAIDLLLSTDVWVFKPICWKRAAVLHRYLARSGTRSEERRVGKECEAEDRWSRVLIHVV